MAFKSPEAAVRNRLVTTPAVTAIVGNRVYPVIAPADADLPFVTWRRTSIQRQHSLSGPIGVPMVMLTVDLFATTYEGVRELADAARVSLDGWGGTFQNTVVSNVSLENESDGFVQLAGGDVPPVYTVQMTFGILWKEI
jgi:hypothetical protein